MLNHKKDWMSVTAVVMLVFTKLAVWMYAPQAVVLWVVLLSVLTFLLHPIRHNHTHVSVFNSSMLNRIYELITSIATLSSSIGIHVIHVVNHHHHNDTEEDWGRTTEFKYRWEFLNYVLYLMTGPVKMVAGYKQWIKKSNNAANKKRHRLETILIYVSLIVMLIINPLATLWFWLLPAIGAFLILVSMNYLQHRGCETESEHDHSRNFTGKVLNILVFNTGYHTVHHLFPSAHWSEYPALHQQYQGAIIKELNYESALWFFLREIVFSTNLSKTINYEK